MGYRGTATNDYDGSSVPSSPSWQKLSGTGQSIHGSAAGQSWKGDWSSNWSMSTGGNWMNSTAWTPAPGLDVQDPSVAGSINYAMYASGRGASYENGWGPGEGDGTNITSWEPMQDLEGLNVAGSSGGWDENASPDNSNISGVPVWDQEASPMMEGIDPMTTGPYASFYALKRVITCLILQITKAICGE